MQLYCVLQLVPRGARALQLAREFLRGLRLMRDVKSVGAEWTRAFASEAASVQHEAKRELSSATPGMFTEHRFPMKKYFFFMMPDLLS